MKIKLMADSTCDLTEELIKKYDISIAPMLVTIEGKEYRDRLDISINDFYHLLPGYRTTPTTSMPNPDSFLSCFREAEENGYEKLLCICMSSGTSGSYQGGLLAKDLYFEQYPQSPLTIEIIDSVSMSHGSGWLIMKCALLRENGYSFEELVEYCESIKYRIKHFLSVEDLANLIRSGRISNATAAVGKVLNIHPIMSMKNKKMSIITKKRGQKQVLQYYLQEFLKRVDDEHTNFIIIGYTSAIQKAEKLKAMFHKETGFKGDIFIMQMGVAVGAHVGLGGLSMFFIEKCCLLP